MVLFIRASKEIHLLGLLQRASEIVSTRWKRERERTVDACNTWYKCSEEKNLRIRSRLASNVSLAGAFLLFIDLNIIFVSDNGGHWRRP